MNPKEYADKALWRSRILLGVTAGMILAGSPPYLCPQWKAIAQGGAILTLAAAWGQRREYERLAQFAGIHSQHEMSAYARFLEVSTALAIGGMEAAYRRSQAIAPQELLPAAEPEPLPQFDWSQLASHPDRYPHLAIVGQSGSGKSTLATWLASQLGGVTIAIAPHWKPGDFAALGDRVYCKSRNFGSESDAACDFADLLNGSAGRVSVVSVVKAISQEMDDRYRRYEQGQDVGPPVNLIWDEIVACLGECPKLAKRYLLPLLREARKVRIRAIALPQDDAVESLGIQGQGQARSNLTYIRLGKFAVRHSRKLDKEYPGIAAAVGASDRPCMVEDAIATVPFIPDAPPLVPQPVPAGDTQRDTQGDTTIADLERAFALESVPDVGDEANSFDPDLLTAIAQLAIKKDGVTAADCIRGSRKFRALPPATIRAMFAAAESAGLGSVDGDGDGVIFRASNAG